jgi:hypothetical protein
MPKKTKNAFYYYMLDYKEEQKKINNFTFENMAQLADAAGIEWRVCNINIFYLNLFKRYNEH